MSREILHAWLEANTKHVQGKLDDADFARFEAKAKPQFGSKFVNAGVIQAIQEWIAPKHTQIGEGKGPIAIDPYAAVKEKHKREFQMLAKVFASSSKTAKEAVIKNLEVFSEFVSGRGPGEDSQGGASQTGRPKRGG